MSMSNDDGKKYPHLNLVGLGGNFCEEVRVHILWEKEEAERDPMLFICLNFVLAIYYVSIGETCYFVCFSQLSKNN